MAGMRFEKWQALGNDYLIVERDELPFELTPARVRALCAGHFGVFADGVLLLSPPADPAHVADLRIFNPDGSEAELSGNGAREAILYLRRRGWTEQDTFTIHTAAGEIRPTITGQRHVPRGHGAGEPALGGLSRGPAGRPGHGPRRWTRLALPARIDRQPPVRDPRRLARGARGAGPRAIGPEIEGDAAVPEPHERVVVHRARAALAERPADGTYARASARGSSSAAWGRRCPPARARPARRSPTCSSGGAASADATATRAGAGALVTVQLDGGELEVEVGEDLRVELTGWARPVFAGRLSEDFEKELHETE